MVILEPLSFSKGNVSNFESWTVLVQLNGSYRALCPVVHGDIAPEYKYKYNTMKIMLCTRGLFKSNTRFKLLPGLCLRTCVCLS